MLHILRFGQMCKDTDPSLPCHVVFLCSKILRVLLTIPQSWKPLSFLLPHRFTFSRVSYSWNPMHVVFSQGFPHGLDGKESAHNTRDLCSIQGLGRSPGEGNGNPLQYSFLENPMDRGAWQATVHRAAKSQAQLSDEHFHFFFHLVISIEVSPVSLHGLIAHFFLVLNNISSSGCTTVPFTSWRTSFYSKLGNLGIKLL